MIVGVGKGVMDEFILFAGQYWCDRVTRTIWPSW